MASEWKRMPLGDFVTLRRGHDLPDESRRPGHVPILGSFGITGWHDVAKARGPGVTVGRSGASFGVVSYSATDYWPLNTSLYVIDFHGNDERFAYYFLKQFDFKGYNSGSAQPSLNRNFVHPVPVDVPPPDEQRAIAHILGTLDDKIELNRRMSETLEAMARALFKSWFVDFDPVRAKAEGRDPGLPDAIATLFPDSFHDSEFGEIPAGWMLQGLGGWAEALSGGTPSKKHPALWGGKIPWFSPKVMTAIHADEADDYVAEDAIGNGTRLAPAGSTLVMVRGMGLHQGVRVSQAQRDVAFNQDVKALVPSKIDPSLLLFALLNAQQELLGRVEYSGHGTGRLPSDVLLAQPITMPEEGAQRILARPFSNMNNRIAIARNEARVLAALRDALLPKLISGEIRLDHPERILGRAG